MRLKASSGGATACSAHCNSMMRRASTTSGGCRNNWASVSAARVPLLEPAHSIPGLTKASKSHFYTHCMRQPQFWNTTIQPHSTTARLQLHASASGLTKQGVLTGSNSVGLLFAGRLLATGPWQLLRRLP